MTLQQLRYLIAIAEYGSINAAAQNLYASQSNLSTAIKDLEQELGITVFTRSNRGVTLTNDGAELLGYARQVIEQADMLEARYAHSGPAAPAPGRVHPALRLQRAGIRQRRRIVRGRRIRIRACARGPRARSSTTCARSAARWACSTPTAFNRRVLFRRRSPMPTWRTSPLFDARVHVFVGEHHPLGQAHSC